jgi:hypothetical protein
MFKVGDRFFAVETGQHFVLLSYNPNLDAWTTNWNTGGQLRIYPEELYRLRFFGQTLVRIKDDKQLFELLLRY